MHNLPRFNQLVHSIETVHIVTPAPGAPVLYTVPTNLILSISSFTFAFVASAAVANRFLSLSLFTASQLVYTFADPVAITAGQTFAISAFLGAQHQHPAPTTGSISWPLPFNLVLYPADTLAITVVALDANDQLTALNFQARSWITD